MLAYVPATRVHHSYLYTLELLALRSKGVRRLSGCTRDLVNGLVGAGSKSVDCGTRGVGNIVDRAMCPGACIIDGAR